MDNDIGHFRIRERQKLRLKLHAGNKKGRTIKPGLCFVGMPEAIRLPIEPGYLLGLLNCRYALGEILSLRSSA
jgi:hypothetical protein